MLKLVCILAALVLVAQLATANNNPLGNCQGGRAVPYSLAASGGTCNLPATQLAKIPVAIVNQAYFGNGVLCGQCFEVTGPLGTKVVQIVDKCDTSAPRCGGDAINFGIDNITFAQIADRNSVDVIYDLGFRQVTCDVTGNVQLQSKSGTTSSIYFFSVVFANYRVGIVDVRVQGSGWSTNEQLKRQDITGVWAWNKANNDLTFPLTVFIVGVTNEIIKGQVTSLSQLTAGGVIDFGTQFADVAGGTGTCPMASSPAVVYLDTLSYGWDASYSFNLTSTVNLGDTANPYVGTTCINVGIQYTGGLQFTRLGGFNPQYFSYLSFAARVNTPSTLVRVYMGANPPISKTITVGTAWQMFNISVLELTANSLETNLVFFNPPGNGDVPITLWLDDIQWVLNPVSPLANVSTVTTTGYIFNTSTTGAPDVTQATTGGFTFPTTSGAFTTTASVTVSFIAVVVAIIAW